jgi:hypothetical protein
MSFSRFLVESGEIHRLNTTVEGDINEWVVAHTGVKACIQPVSEEIIALGKGDFYNTFTIYFPITEDVREGDKYIVAGISYILQGVQSRGYNKRTNHLQAFGLREN